MVRPKEVIKVIAWNTFIQVFADSATHLVADVMSVEGVKRVSVLDEEMTVLVDQRYDSEEVAEVATEIRDLLTQEVPQIFKDDMKLG